MITWIKNIIKREQHKSEYMKDLYNIRCTQVETLTEQLKVAKEELRVSRIQNDLKDEAFEKDFYEISGIYTTKVRSRS